MSESPALAHLTERLQATLASMPPVAAMQIQLHDYAEGRMQLRAPLAVNVNDKGNAFGGSLASVMTLAGWALATLQLQRAGHDAEVYVADSSIRYLSPVHEDLLAVATAQDDSAWDGFVATFAQRGRARISLQCRLMLADGTVAAELTGRFVAFGR